MSLGLRLASVARWKHGALVLVSSVALAALGYQAPLRLELDLGSVPVSALATEGFYDAEGGYRWSRARSAILLPDPGARDDLRLELLLSGFRPPGAEPPLLVIEAGGRALRLRPSRRVQAYALETGTQGLWSSTLRVSVRSDTFSPGGGDERALGVRVHRARLEGGGAGSLPPFRQLLASGGLALLVFLGVSAAGRSRALALSSALVLSVAVALGYALFRLWTALSVPPLAIAAGAAAGAAWLWPAGLAFLAEVVARTRRPAAEALTLLRSRAALVAAAVAALSCTVAYVAAPRLELDVGSGRAEPILHRFGAGDLDETGVRFRRALAGAQVDLSDFGWGRPWRVEIRARAAGGPARGALVRIAGEPTAAELDATWSTTSVALAPPEASWRSGYTLSFPGMGAGTHLDVASIRVVRGRGLPSGRALALALWTSIALAMALGAAGLDRLVAAAGAALGAALLSAGLALDPVVFTPFLGTAALAASAGAALTVLTRGGLEALHARGVAPELHPAALGIGAVAFILWFVSSASPLYSGGHFAYHSSVAERIWQGDFLIYYLPGPDNMLARQPQWGDAVVPHPCLYHTVASPFAALPDPWFGTLTKLFLAWMLFGIAVVSALLATDLAGPRAGAYASALVAATPIGFQLLGLGHLMTLFGCWAAALALGLVTLRVDRLGERRWFLLALGLTALSFLSYTGSLLFGSLSLVAAAVILAPSTPRTSRRLGLLVTLGWGLALALYYWSWVAPFVTETLPAAMSGSGRGTSLDLDLGARLAAMPRKLDYTYGTFLVPLAALGGIFLAAPATKRVMLGCWAGVLVLVSALDLFFNFLLKHHYFALPAVAVGLALAAERFEKRGRWARGILAIFFVYLLWMGIREGLSTARGGA